MFPSEILIMRTLRTILFFAYFVSLGACSRRSREDKRIILVDGYTKQDPTDEAYREVASRAIRKFDHRYRRCSRKIEKIVEAETLNVVTDILYRLTIKMCGPIGEGCHADSFDCDKCILHILKERDDFPWIAKIECRIMTAWNYENSEVVIMDIK